MQVPNFTAEQLKLLPLRAIVAFAARCARRVEPLTRLPEGYPQRVGRQAAIEAGLFLAEAYARGSDALGEEWALAAIEATRGVAHGLAGNEEATAAAAAAAHAAVAASHLTTARVAPDEPSKMETPEARELLKSLSTVTADLAALSAFTAAVEAFISVGYDNESFVAAAQKDYDSLVCMRLGTYPAAGSPVDPSPDGPLGPL